MAKPVLIDSSVWIDYFRKDQTVFSTVNQLAEDNRVYLIGLVLAELLQGCKTKKEITVVQDLTDIFPRLKETSDMWNNAGMLAFKLRRQGRTIGLADCYIAAVALSNDALIFSHDKHFDELATFCKLEVYNY